MQYRQVTFNFHLVLIQITQIPSNKACSRVNNVFIYVALSGKEDQAFVVVF